MNKYLLMTSVAMINIAITSESWAATIVENGSCGTDCTYTLDSEGVLNITGSGTMADYEYKDVYDEVKDEWYSHSTAPWGDTGEKMQRITKVVIGGGITNIGNESFFGATNLSNIEMPNVTSVGIEAFEGATSLTSVTMPNVTSVGNGAFCGATSLTSVEMPNVTSIGLMAFEGATSLTSVDIPMLEKIGDLAFSDTNMQYANVPSTHVYCINVFDDSTCENQYYTSDLGFPNSDLCVVSDGHLICGSCNGYTKSGVGCVTDCGTGYSVDSSTNRCVADTPSGGDTGGSQVSEQQGSGQATSAAECVAGGKYWQEGKCVSSCGSSFKFNDGWCDRQRYTPAEAAAVLTNDNNNSVTITFKK